MTSSLVTVSVNMKSIAFGLSTEHEFQILRGEEGRRRARDGVVDGLRDTDGKCCTSVILMPETRHLAQPNPALSPTM
eukprot:scaffold170276_cov36-Tisochrysis_lutea.AAC.1